jgi:glycosyltransferase involved in cell wall biosynthesis
VEAKPDVWLPETVRTAKLRAGMEPLPPKPPLPTAVVHSEPDPFGHLGEILPCKHRSGRWSCCETLVFCALGQGEAAGIVNPEDCRGCSLREAESDLTPINLGILSPGCYTGGAEMWMLALLGKLDHSRVIPAGVAIAYGQHIDLVMRAKLETLCPVSVGPEAIDQLWQDCDVVLVWGVPSWDQRLPPRPRRAKAILVSHGVGPWTVPIFNEPDRADGWAAVSNAALDPIPASHKGRAAVLANGIDLARITPSEGARERIRNDLGITASQRLAMYLGRISDEKNPRAFLDLAAESERRWPGRFAFVVVGDGLGWPKETTYAKQKAPHVTFVGVQRNIGDWLAASDHVVMTSHEEADSLALLEAFAAGRPVVSTRVGRLREAEYARLARVMEVNPTADMLADALDLEATDSSIPSRVAKAREITLSRHTAEAMAARWMDYVERVGQAKQPAQVEGRRVEMTPGLQLV